MSSEPKERRRPRSDARPESAPLRRAAARGLAIALVLLLVPTLACASDAPAVDPGTDQADVVEARASEPAVAEAGDGHEFSVRVEPRTLYTINFVSGPGGADVAARFETRGGPVVAMAIAHPRSDLLDGDGEVQLDCPGLTGHPLHVSSTGEPVRTGTLYSRSTEQGHFGFVFANDGDAAVELEFELVPARSTISVTYTGVLPASAIRPRAPAGS